MAEPESFPRRFGKYKLLCELAQGGMGAVYLAASGVRGMEKVCALKVVLPGLATPEYRARFMDEGKVMVRLTHGNLVQVFDVGEVGDEAYIAMEFVAGQDLRTIWNRCVEVKRAFPVDVAIHILKDACRGLAYAHSYEDLRLVLR
ncbi:MAG: protein kinase, partial [Polyangia bacterium]|nr:protein kinase [Polyangia bacterium]